MTTSAGRLSSRPICWNRTYSGTATAIGGRIRWEISQNYFRLRACCNPIYAALDALEEALAELRPTPEEIDRIDVATYRFASVMQHPQPQNTFAARYSLPHAAAAMVVRGNAGYGAFTDAVLHDPTIAALRQRVHIAADPQLTAMAPRL